MSERDEFEAILGDLMMVIEYCETQTYIERGSAMWDGLANLRRYAAVRARATPKQGVPALTRDYVLRIGKETGLVDWLSDDGDYFTFTECIEASSEYLIKFAQAILAAAPQPPKEKTE